MTIPTGTPTAQALKQAMARLLSGRPALTDGRLTVANLAREAGLSRATAYRSTGIIEAFQDEIRTRGGRRLAPTVRRERIAALESERADLQARAREERHALNATIDTMAQRIQALTLLTKEQERRIADLHEELSRSGVVTPLGRRGLD